MSRSQGKRENKKLSNEQTKCYREVKKDKNRKCLLDLTIKSLLLTGENVQSPLGVKTRYTIVLKVNVT